MKLLVLHGAAKVASRKKLTDLKQKFDTNNAIVYEEGADLQTVLGSISTPSLFSDEQLIILENPSEDFVNLPLNPTHHTLVRWFDHEVSEKKTIMERAKKKWTSTIFPGGERNFSFPIFRLSGSQG